MARKRQRKRKKKKKGHLVLMGKVTVKSILYTLLIELIFKPLRCNRMIKILFVYHNYHKILFIYPNYQ